MVVLVLYVCRDGTVCGVNWIFIGGEFGEVVESERKDDALRLLLWLDDLALRDMVRLKVCHFREEAECVAN